MMDLRMIDISDDGEVNITASKMHTPIKGREAAIQRATIAILTTAGTIVESPLWGGSATGLFMMSRESDDETTRVASSVIEQARSSLIPGEPEGDTYQIIDMRMVGSINRTSESGYSISVQIEYAGARSETIKIPERNYVPR